MLFCLITDFDRRNPFTVLFVPCRNFVLSGRKFQFVVTRVSGCGMEWMIEYSNPRSHPFVQVTTGSERHLRMFEYEGIRRSLVGLGEIERRIRLRHSMHVV